MPPKNGANILKRIAWYRSSPLGPGHPAPRAWHRAPALGRPAAWAWTRAAQSFSTAVGCHPCIRRAGVGRNASAALVHAGRRSSSSRRVRRASAPASAAAAPSAMPCRYPRACFVVRAAALLWARGVRGCVVGTSRGGPAAVAQVQQSSAASSNGCGRGRGHARTSVLGAAGAAKEATYSIACADSLRSSRPNNEYGTKYSCIVYTR
jgi:hypothetical protein